MQFHPKKILIYLISRVFFFCLDIFKFSGPLRKYRPDPSLITLYVYIHIIIGIGNFFSSWQLNMINKLFKLTPHVNRHVRCNGQSSIIIGCHTGKSLAKICSVQSFDKQSVYGWIVVKFKCCIHDLLAFVLDWKPSQSR